MAGRLPRFVPLADPVAGPAELMWSATLRPKLTFFLYLTALENQDVFTVELGWSDDGTFPWQNDSFKFENVEVPKGRARLSCLWTVDGRDRGWAVVPVQTSEQLRAKLDAMSRGDWETVQQIRKSLEVSPEEAARRVPPLANDGFERIVHYGLPLFRRIARAHGIEWNPEFDDLGNMGTRR